MSRIELDAGETALVRGLLARHLPDREVRVFGSRAGGRTKHHSDLDLVVMGEDSPPKHALAELRLALEESDLPFQVDVVIFGDLPDSLRQHIDDSSLLLQSRLVPGEFGDATARPRSSGSAATTDRQR